MTTPTQAPALPITLERVLFTRASVLAMRGFNPTEPVPPLLPVNKLDVQALQETPVRFLVTMQTVLNPDHDTSFPYALDMECLAVFVADESQSTEEAKKAATITGHHVTYGAIRETVSWLTGRQPYGTYILGLSVLTPSAPDELKPKG